MNIDVISHTDKRARALEDQLLRMREREKQLRQALETAETEIGRLEGRLQEVYELREYLQAQTQSQAKPPSNGAKESKPQKKPAET